MRDPKDDPDYYNYVSQINKTGEPLKDPGPHIDDDGTYNPYEHRLVKKPTNDWETLAHLLKGALGTGVLAIPLATSYAGLGFGLIAIFLTGFIITYSIYLLIRSSQRLCARHHIPQLAFDEVGHCAFHYGPEKWKFLAIHIKRSINAFLSIDLFGCCTVYTIFSAKNLKQVVDWYSDSEHGAKLYTDREYILMLMPFLLLYIMIRTLKYLAPLSFLADVLVISGMIILLYYMFRDELPPLTSRPFFGLVKNYPLFFGISIFALEAVGVVMPLENNMTIPGHFIQGPRVLFIGFVIVVSLYATIGFFGFLKYGDDIRGSITLNVREDEIGGQLVKLFFALAMLQTFGLQFYVPFQILWRRYVTSFGKWNLLVEWSVRWAISFTAIMIGYAIPSIGSIMSFIGSLTLSFLGLIFPAMIDMATRAGYVGFGKYKWVLCTDIAIVIFGVIGCFCGTTASVIDIYAEYFKN